MHWPHNMEDDKRMKDVVAYYTRFGILGAGRIAETAAAIQRVFDDGGYQMTDHGGPFGDWCSWKWADR